MFQVRRKDDAVKNGSIRPTRPRARQRKVTAAAAIDTLFPLPQRVLRMERIDGATIVLSGPDTKEMAEYYEHVQAWFDDADLNAQKKSGTAQQFERSAREVDEFIEATNNDARLAPPSDCTIDIEYPPTTKRPPAVVGDTFTTTGLLTRRSVSSFILARDDERFVTDTGLAVRHREDTVEAEVEMREPSDDSAVIIPMARRAKPDHNAIRSAASQLGGVHEDVLDICIANAVRNGPNSSGRYEIEVEAIVRVRGKGQKKKQEGPARYNAGFVPAMRENVVSALGALDRIWVTQDLEPKLRKGRLVRDYDRVFEIKRKRVDVKTHELVSIEYELGTWFANYKEHLVLAPRALLALDARNGAPAKALGRYFVLLTASADRDGRLVRSVRDVIATVRRSFDYGKNPQRLRSWLEDNLEVLVEHGIITSWTYTPAADLAQLPRKNWVDHWLELSVVVQLPARAHSGE